MVVYNNVLAGAAGSGGSGYKIERSLRFNDSDSAHLTRTFSAGNSKKWTWAAWVKRNKLGGYQTLFGHVSGTSGQHYIDFGSDKIRFTRYVSSNEAALETEAVYRDVSAWMHVCAIWDVKNTTANHRQRLFVNGLEVTEFSVRTNPSENYSGGVINTAISHDIGKVLSQNYGAFQLADVHFLDGIVAGISTDDAAGSVTGTPNAAYLTDFGEFSSDTGVWNPVEYSGSYGTHTAPTYDSTYGSDITSTEVAKTIDGDLSTYGVPTGDFIGYVYSASNEPFINIKWENTKSSNITVYIQPWVGGSAANSGTFDSSGANSVTIAAGATLNTKFNFPSGYQGYFRVYTSGDGVYLRMYDTGGTREFNSFHLDFSDNSSEAALGYDAANSNNWTVNNISAASFDAIGNTSHVGPGTLTSLATSVYYNLFAIDTNNVGSNPGSGALARFNFSALGLTAPATITFDSYEQGGGGWTTVSSNIYTDAGTVTSTYTSSGNTRSNTVSIPSGATYFEIPGSYNSTYNLYSNGIHNLTWNGVSYQHAGAEDIDTLIDSPTDYQASSGNNGGNYSTLNRLAGTNTLSNGNLEVAGSTASWAARPGTIGVSSGKWYFEFTSTGNHDSMVGIGTSDISLSTYAGADANGYSYYASNGQKYNGGGASYGASWVSGDTIGVAFDADNGTLVFYKNGTSQGTAFTGIPSGTYLPIISNVTSGSGICNFGQRPFKHTPPTGYKSICTTNLPDPLIANGQNYFDTKLYTGNGGYQIVGGGTRWSDYVTGDIDSANPATQGFRNRTDLIGVRTQTFAGATIVFQPPTPIAFTSSFKIWAARDGTSTNTTFTVTHAGGDTDFTSSVVTSTTQTAVDLAQISGVTSPITKITVVSGGPNPRFSGIEVDGTMLIDSTANPYKFSPDLVWTKARSATHWHILGDTIRGAGPTLSSNINYLEWNDGLYSSFNSDGFTVAQVSTNQSTNGAGQTHVGWAWEAGDLVTNSAYNQSQTWSDSLSTNDTLQNPVNAFDGNTATRAQTANAAAGKTITFAPATDVSFTTSFEVYCDQGGSAPTATWNGNTINPGGGAWVTVYNGSGTINSSTPLVINTQTAAQYATLKGIRLDGKILVDAGVIPVGSLNSSAYNDGEVWSTTGTLVVDLNGSTVTNMTGALSKAFNGSTADSEQVTEGSSYSSGTKTYTYTFGTAQTNVTSARVYCYKGNSAEGGTVSFGNGTVNKPADSAYGWIDATSTIPSNGTISALTFTTTATSSIGSARNGFHAIELNGKILLDNGVTAVDNFPSIPSTVRANQTAGFSIVSFTGTGAAQTTGHGLNATPGLVLLKNRTTNNTHWQVFGDGYERLQLTTTQSILSGDYTLERTSTTISPTQNSVSELQINQNGDKFVAYCWAPVENYSAFGSFESNGSADGPFIYTGFAVAFLLVKSADTTYDWFMYDSVRQTYNALGPDLRANRDYVEQNSDRIDFLSNGFKLRTNSAANNSPANNTWIYAAFASSPFKHSRAI